MTQDRPCRPRVKKINIPLITRARKKYTYFCIKFFSTLPTNWYTSRTEARNNQLH